MTQTGDDCYFYYYSTCVKGDECPFRHQPAARGCEITCNLWEKGRCFKKACTFRHMVIEKDRSTIPCLWESQPSGCMKPYCPFLHTKPKNIPTSQAPGQSIPTLGAQVPSNVGRGGPGVRPPPMYNNNQPRPGMPPNQPPHMSGPRGPQPMQQRPMGYHGYIPHGQPSHPMMYQMHPNNRSHMAPMPYPGMMMPNMMMNQPARGDYMMGLRPRGRDDYDDSDDDYTSSDYSDVSISDDERRERSRESSRRRVRSPCHSSSRREVRQRNDREKKPEPRSPRESYSDRKSSRRRHDSDKEKTKKDSERSRSKPRKESENKESSSSDRKKSESSDEKSKSEAEEKKSDIKIKTLEEILREKALKNLHERTAQKKKAQLEAEKAKKEGSDDSPEPILKSVVSVSKAEPTSSQNLSESRDSDPEVEFVREKRARSPKTIILDIIDPDNEASTSSKTLRQVKVKTDDNKTEKTKDEQEESEQKDSPTKPVSSDLSSIKVKTFDEIMEEKRQRKVQGEKPCEEHKEEPSETQKTVITESKPTRKIIRVVKKGDTKKEPATAGKVVAKRKVQTTARKGVESSSEVETQDQEEKKTEKKAIEKQRPTNIVIKSFDEIMREKRLRKQGLTETQQPTTQESTTETTTTTNEPTIAATTTTTQELTTATTTTSTVTRPTIIRNKPTTTVHPRSFKPRKLKVIGRQGVCSSNISSVSEPGSPSTPNPMSPTSPTKSEPMAHSLTSNSAPQSPTSPVKGQSQPTGHTQGDAIIPSNGDDSDDDSWEHEELPAVPLETPTLEGPAQIPDIPSTDNTTVLHIPGKVVQPAVHTSPTKRPRSSLEELFGVPCDNADSSKPSQEDQSDGEEEKDVSPKKKIKTSQDNIHDDIVKAVNTEMSKKDDLDLDLEKEIANLPDKHYDAHESLNEDDLLLELEEMINN